MPSSELQGDAFASMAASAGLRRGLAALRVVAPYRAGLGPDRLIAPIGGPVDDPQPRLRARFGPDEDRERYAVAGDQRVADPVRLSAPDLAAPREACAGIGVVPVGADAEERAAVLDPEVEIRYRLGVAPVDQRERPGDRLVVPVRGLGRRQPHRAHGSTARARAGRRHHERDPDHRNGGFPRYAPL